MPVEKIKHLFESPEITPEEANSMVNAMDHFEIARLLHQFPVNDKIRVFHCLDSDKKRQELLYETDYDSRQEIQKSLEPGYLAALLDEMEEDEATDLLKEHDEESRQDILDKMAPKDASIIKDLITYGEETAGGLMVPTYNRVAPEQKAKDILVQIKRDNNRDSPPYFYVIDNQNQLLGFFKLRDLLNVSTDAQAIEFVRKETPKVQVDDPCDKVANLMDNSHLSSLPVVDENNLMLGIVTFDDVIRIMEDLASEDIYTMVGTSKMDPFAKRTLSKIAARAPWLFTTFVGGLASALILSHFKVSLTEFATVVFFVPFVLGIAGNVGLQAATVIVRGLATGDIQADNLATVVKSELLVGAANGLIFGIICGAIVTVMAEPLLGSTPFLGIIVGSGIIFAVCFAAIIGALSPILFLNMNIDPAISAGPFVTITNDIAGIAIYLTTALIIFNTI